MNDAEWNAMRVRQTRNDWLEVAGVAAIWVVVIALVFIAGCAPATVIKEPIEVRVPIAVPCIPKAVEVPSWATDKLAQQASYYERVSAVLQELAQRIAYEVELRAAIDGCTGKQPDQPKEKTP